MVEDIHGYPIFLEQAQPRPRLPGDQVGDRTLPEAFPKKGSQGGSTQAGRVVDVGMFGFLLNDSDGGCLLYSWMIFMLNFSKRIIDYILLHSVLYLYISLSLMSS